MSATVGVDLGGTKILAAVVEPDGDVTGREKIATPRGGPSAVVSAIADLILGLDASPTAVGIGAPGPVAGGILLHAPNLAGFNEPFELAAEVAKEVGCEVVVANDASLGTLGEVRHGAAKGSDHVLGCWLGTGIGGGLVLNGQLVEGAHGAAGEIGHVPVALGDAPVCGCGRTGCVEAWAGRASMEKAARRAMAAGEASALEEIRVDKGKDRYTSGVWKAALKDGDPLVTRLMDEAVRALGAAIAGAINLTDVDTIVFGGGLSEKLGSEHAQRIADASQPHLIAPDLPRRWVVAELGDDAGVIGAAVRAHEAIQPTGS